MSNIFKAALGFMGFFNTEEGDDFKIGTTSRKNNEKIVSLHPKTSHLTIEHITPKTFDDVMNIAKMLQDKTIVTINLALVDVALRNQIIDFVSGSVYALDGGVMELSDNVYLLAAQGVTLQDRQRDTSKFTWSKEPK